MPKSSSEKRQPRAFSARMNEITRSRFAIAAVSVISKHSAPGTHRRGRELVEQEIEEARVVRASCRTG